MPLRGERAIFSATHSPRPHPQLLPNSFHRLIPQNGAASTARLRLTDGGVGCEVYAVGGAVGVKGGLGVVGVGFDL